MKISKRLVSHCRFPQESSRGKRALPLLLLAAVLLLSACSAGGQEPSPDEPQVLTYAVLDPNGYDREAVDTFNEAHTDIQIQIVDYRETEGGQSGKDRLLTEITANKIPDIIDLSGLPYQRLARKGYLKDLWPFIENDPALGRDGVMEAPLKAAEVDGGLYMAFNRVSVATLAGPEAIVGNRTSWSIEELQTAFAAMPEGSTILEYIYPKDTVFYYIAPLLLDSYIDWSTGKCSFDSEEFRSVLAFINSFPNTEPDWSQAESINEELADRLESGRQMLTHTYLRDLLEMHRYDKIYSAAFGGRASFVGFPVEDGSMGSYFCIEGRKLALSSSCQNQDAAWEFLRTVFLPKFSSNYADYTALPINRRDFELLKAGQMEHAPSGPFELYSGLRVQLEPLTEEEYERFMAFFNSVEKTDLYDTSVFDIVRESVGPYFAGDKSLDDTVALVQSRVGLYVSEQQ